jgi:carbonic anhydrase/acetyltransferase-like protein (isoleucine patch superfamily)
MPLFALDGIAPDVPPEGSYWVAPSASIIGKVRLGRGVGVWFGSVLRGDNELIDVGEGSNIQEHCVLHTDMGAPLTLGRGCTVGHRAILHGCVIGNHCLIGMGATILNHAIVGEGSLIGAHTLVTEGKSIPPCSLVMGSPAKVVRELTPEEVARLEASAAHYVENWHRYARGLALVGA